LNPLKDQWNKYRLAAVHSDFIVSFNDSDKADQIRNEIYNEGYDIHEALARLMDQAYANEPINKPGVQDLNSKLTAIRHQFDLFSDQTRLDLRPPNGGLSS
jgi:hypothetical protein